MSLATGCPATATVKRVEVEEEDMNISVRNSLLEVSTPEVHTHHSNLVNIVAMRSVTQERDERVRSCGARIQFAGLHTCRSVQSVKCSSFIFFPSIYCQFYTTAPFSMGIIF